MRTAALALIALIGVASVTLPASAKVLVEGAPSPGGFYWQKVQKADKSIQYSCRKKGDSAIQKSAQCNGAKAVKP